MPLTVGLRLLHAGASLFQIISFNLKEVNKPANLHHSWPNEDQLTCHANLADTGKQGWCRAYEDSQVFQRLNQSEYAGQIVPKGRAAVGWRIAVHWREDAKFYAGEVVSFDTATGRHEILYDDGVSASRMCIAAFRSNAGEDQHSR